MERFYLDTNIIFSYFLKKFSEKKGRKIEAKIANFLMNSSQRVKYVVSALTKAEIVRKLRSEFNSEEDDIKEMWEDFLSDVSPLYISVTQSLDEIYEEITKIVFKIPIKKRVTNLEHLIIAMKNDLIFVTGDKEIVEKCRSFYEKVWDYRTLRRALREFKMTFKNKKEKIIMEGKKELTEEERRRREEAWERAAERFWETLEYWKKHNPKKYRKFWRDYKKLEEAFGF